MSGRGAMFVFLGAFLLSSATGVQAEPTLTAIEVTPNNPSIDIGQTLQFSAMGSFDDGSSRVLGGNVWAAKAPLPITQTTSGVATLNGNFYVLGGYNPLAGTSTLAAVNRYEPSTDIWTPRSSLLTSRACLGTGVVGGVLYAVGGANKAAGMPTVLLNTVEAYDPATDTWVVKASMSTLSGCVKVGAVDGILYAVGVPSIIGPALVEAYDPATNTWSAKSPVPLPVADQGLSGFATATLDGNLYVLGGRSLSGNTLATVYAYDPTTDTWSTKAPMPTPRWLLGADTTGGLLYAIGGAYLETSVVEAYNPQTNSWTSMASLPRAGEAYVAADDANGLLYALTEVEVPQGYVDFRGLWAYQPAEALWSSSNAVVATTDGNGLVTASVIPGASMIIATAGGVNGHSTLRTVPQPVRGLAVRVSGSGTVTSGTGTTVNDGILCPGDCRERYVMGTTVVLTAVADYPLITSIAWGGDCVGQGNPCTLQMDAFHRVTATFTTEPDY